MYGEACTSEHLKKRNPRVHVPFTKSVTANIPRTQQPDTEMTTDDNTVKLLPFEARMALVSATQAPGYCWPAPWQ